MTCLDSMKRTSSFLKFIRIPKVYKDSNSFTYSWHKQFSVKISHWKFKWIANTNQLIKFINFWKFYVQFTLFCSIFTTLFQVTISPCPNYCSSHFICLYVSIHPPHSSIQELSKYKGKVQTLWSNLFVLTWLHPLPLLNVWKKVKVTQSCLTLSDPMDCIVHGILQSQILE